MSNKSKQTSLFQTIAQNTIGLITTAIFSIGLISGSGFLLFDSKNELNKMSQRNAEIGKQTAEFNLGSQMATIGGSGWFSTTESGKILGITIGLLQKSLPNDALDNTFAETTITWSFKSLAQLTSEKEQISGYVFSNKTILQSQSAILKVYDKYIGLVQEILDLTQKWEGITFEQRQSQFSTLRIKWLDTNASVDALNTSSSQMKSDFEISMKQSELKLNEMKDDYDTFNTKFWLSITGVILGFVLLCGSITYLAKKYFPSQKKTHNISARKTTKAKEKSR